jgi:hypothetical protein
MRIVFVLDIYKWNHHSWKLGKHGDKYFNFKLCDGEMQKILITHRGASDIASRCVFSIRELMVSSSSKDLCWTQSRSHTHPV